MKIKYMKCSRKPTLENKIRTEILKIEPVCSFK
jgi:hypothetical protein